MLRLLSIVTITYNDPLGLRRTIESLKGLSANGINWEHIVVDGSPSVTDIKACLPSGWPLVHVISEPKGVYSAMNDGIRHSGGEYIWILNGGDSLSDINCLRSILEFMESSSNYDLVCVGGKFYLNDVFQRTIKPKTTFMTSLVGENKICHQGVIYRKNIFASVGLFNEGYKIAGDYEFHLRCISHKVLAICLNKVLVSLEAGGLSYNLEKSLSERYAALKSNWSKISIFQKIIFFFGYIIESLRLVFIKRIRKSLLNRANSIS